VNEGTKKPAGSRRVLKGLLEGECLPAIRSLGAPHPWLGTSATTKSERNKPESSP